MSQRFINAHTYTHPANQNWVRSSVLFNDKELIPDPSSFGPVKYLTLLPCPLFVSMERQVTYKDKNRHVDHFQSTTYLLWAFIEMLNGLRLN